MSVARRVNHYHGGAKGKIINNTVKPAPAWQARNIPANASTAADPGSKILISNLPSDVGAEEIEDLMRKTVGPVNMKDTMMFYNAKGFPLGIAIVAFTKEADAAKARAQYNGKVIDGKRAIKLELVIDRLPEISAPPQISSAQPKPQQKPKPKSLFERIAPLNGAPNGAAPKSSPQPRASRSKPVAKPAVHVVSSTANTNMSSVARARNKKGPRRVKKPVTKMDLDAEMDAYRAGADIQVA